LQTIPNATISNSSIKNRADVLANLPDRAKWFPKEDAVAWIDIEDNDPRDSTGDDPNVCVGPPFEPASDLF
jgi:hypothetical protein